MLNCDLKQELCFWLFSKWCFMLHLLIDVKRKAPVSREAAVVLGGGERARGPQCNCLTKQGFLFFLRFILIVCVCAYECECKCPGRSEVLDPSGTGDADSCKPPDMSAGN